MLKGTMRIGIARNLVPFSINTPRCATIASEINKTSFFSRRNVTTFQFCRIPSCEINFLPGESWVFLSENFTDFSSDLVQLDRKLDKFWTQIVDNPGLREKSKKMYEDWAKKAQRLREKKP